MYKVALVTVLFKCDEVLEGFFKSLHAQSFSEYKLYLIDNSPSEATDLVLQTLSEKYPLPDIQHIKCEGNIGVASGNNIGINQSLQDGAAYTLLLNNDIEFYQPDLLTQMVSEADSRNENLLIPKIYFYGTKTIWMAGGIIMRTRATSIHVGEGEVDKGQFNVEQYFEYAPTCFMLIKNEVFDKVGTMDEKYFVYYDDTDFLYRACSLGYKILYLPTLEIFHKVSFSTGGDESAFSIYYGTRNRIYFIYRNLTGINFLISSVYTGLSKIYKYLSYNSKQKEALIKGIQDGFKLCKT